MVLASGGDASSTNGSVSYTIGQVVYSTHMGLNGSVAEGVQQPYEISIITGFKQAKAYMLECAAFPNPVKYHLVLKVENFDNQHLFYQLYDEQGNILQNKKVKADKTTIVFENLKPAIYFLRITQDKKEKIVFKIIKH